MSVNTSSTTQQQLKVMSSSLDKRLSSSSSIHIDDKNNVDQVKTFAFAVCREFLGGAWNDVDYSDFDIKRISAGLSNYLYVCEIDDHKFNQVDNEPKRILLRLYGENSIKNSSTLLKDIVISAIMSDNCLGPKLYGLFSIGRLEEFICYPTMGQMDMYVPELSRSIARVMARFHTLEMPLTKEPRWLFESTQRYAKQATEIAFTGEIDVRKFEKFLSYDLQNEFKQLKIILKSLNSPVVFCHNDINVGNILKLPSKLMIIDYEYGSYNYRGFDLGNHFCEWMFNNAADEHPYYEYAYELYPTRAQQVDFAIAYVDEFKRATKEVRSKKMNDSSSVNKDDFCGYGGDEWAAKKLNVDGLLIEANYFALASHLYWAHWAVCQASTCKIRFEYLDYALARCDAYFKQKKILFPDGFKQI